jgi:hypothetical protein
VAPGYAPIMALKMCGARIEVSAPLQTHVSVATEFVAIGDLIGSGEAHENGIVGETPNLAAPHGSTPQRSNSTSIALKTISASITARVVKRMIAARAAAFTTGTFTYTSSFQYSLTSYLRTSSTQVVSSPCRGISRS